MESTWSERERAALDVPDEFDEESIRAIAVLLDALPGLLPNVVQLTDDFGDLPSAQCVFSELAGITSQLFGSGLDDEDEEQLERIFAAIEAVATAPGLDTTSTVAFSFLDGLDPGAVQRAQGYLGPATERILEQLEEGGLTLG